MNIPLDKQNIINILGLQALSDERKAELINNATELVQKRLLVRILDSLSDSEQKEFNTILDQNNQDSFQQFLTEKIPNLPDLLTEETTKLKQEFADLSAKIE